MDSASSQSARLPTQRYSIIPEWVTFSKDLTGDHVRLYSLLARYGGQIFPGVAALAEKMDCSTRSIRRYMDALEAVGALRRTHRFDDDGRQTSNLYELAGDAPFDRGEEVSAVTPEDDEAVTHNESNNERETGTLTGSPSRQSAQLALVDDFFARAIQREQSPTVELNEIKEAIVAVCGEPSTSSGWGLVNRLATFIRNRGDPPESVALRATLMAQEWGPGKVTVASLEKHWTRYDAGRIGRLSQEDIGEYQRQLRDLKFRRSLDDIGET